VATIQLPLTYDAEDDKASIRLAEDPIAESEEVPPGIIFDYGEDGRIVVIQVREASRQLSNSAFASRHDAHAAGRR
jgi:uncharacterized protein YuzE